MVHTSLRFHPLPATQACDSIPSQPPSPCNSGYPTVVMGRPCMQAWLIDFDYSRESCDPEAQAAELAQLHALFRPSDTDASAASGTQLLMLSVPEQHQSAASSGPELTALSVPLPCRDGLGLAGIVRQRCPRPHR